MAAAKVNTTKQEVGNSVTSIYSKLLEKRQSDREIKEQLKREDNEAKRLAKEDQEEDEKPLTKKEKREASLNAWQGVLIGLTGDDLEYISPKKKGKRKYKQWIGDDIQENIITVKKSDKKKKKNYQKEFEPDLNMLKSLVADQNRFTIDLLKRYQNAAGPNTKDAMPLNKTLVELASVINASRGNSLGLLREVGNLKKTVAQLYHKQQEIDNKNSGGNPESSDIGIMGSSIASSMFGNLSAYDSRIEETPSTIIPSSPISIEAPTEVSVNTFDPSTWGGLDVGAVRYEAIPHSIVVEWHKDSDKARFKAVRDDNGEELIGAPIPQCTIRTFDEANKMAKDELDQVYKLEII